MKKYIILFIALFAFYGITNAQTVAIPDSNFEQALIELGIDTNGVNNSVLLSDIQGVTTLDLNGKNINDLSGIENFSSLIELFVNSNNLTTLEISQITTLENLSCRNNQINALNVSQNSALKVLSCGNNLLENLDVSQNTNLLALNCSDNSISELDVTQNLDLLVFGCSENELSCLDVSQNTLLTMLICDSNQLTSLDVSQNTDLEQLYVGNNLIKSLDLSNNSNIIDFSCYSNQLTYLNAKNGNNSAIGTFYTLSNPDLTCIEVDDVAYSSTNWTDVDTNSSFSLDCNQIASVYVPDDNFEQALIDLGYDCVLDDYVPAANINAITNLNVSQKNINDLTGIEGFTSLSILKCHSNNLTTLDLTNNPALFSLDCFANELTSLDLSQNTALTQLQCQGNQLTSLNVQNGNNSNFSTFVAVVNPPLTCIQVDNVAYSTANWANIDDQVSFSIDCNSNVPITIIPDPNFEQALIDLNLDSGPIDGSVPTNNIYTITGLNVFNKNISDLTGIADFVALNYLICGSNQLTSLDVSALSNLVTFSCSGNLLSTLDLSQNTALNSLDCSSNNLTSLNVKNGNNTIFEDFDSTYNPDLLCIDVDDASYSTANWTTIDPASSFSEDCSVTTPLTYVPDDNFEQALIDLDYDSGPLDDYVPTANINTITSLNVANKNIEDLTGIADFVALTILRCNNNNLTTLDLTNNTALFSLRCFANDLTSLDLSLNIALTYLQCQGNQLTSLNVKNGNNTNITTFIANVNPPLTCIQVDDAVYSTANWSTIDDQVSFSEDCSTLNLDNLDFKSSISIYPNPASEVVHIQVPNYIEIDTVELVNIAGKSIKTSSSSNIDVSQLASGFYFLKINFGNQWVIKKLLID